MLIKYEGPSSERILEGFGILKSGVETEVPDELAAPQVRAGRLKEITGRAKPKPKPKKEEG